METLQLGATLVTKEPRVLLDPKLKTGTYRLQLVVAGERGESVPAEMRIVITRPSVVIPTPVIPTPVIRKPVIPTPVIPTPVIPTRRRG